jgi:hypothetical protein
MGWWAEGNGGAVGGEVIFEEDGRGRKREEERGRERFGWPDPKSPPFA